MEQRGVVELATALYDCVRFSVADKTLQDRLLPVLEKTIRVRESLENALAAWDPKQADKLSTTLEDLLDELERLAPEPAFVISGTQNKKKRKAPWHRLIR